MMVSQVYLTETSPSALKGQICPGYFLGVFTGFILAHLSSICFAYNLRAMFGIGLIPSLIQFFLISLFLKESPAFLQSQGKIEEASTAIE